MSGRAVRMEALILAGGRSSRMQGTDKPSAVVDGMSLVDRVVEAASFCDTVVVVGPSDAASPRGRPSVLHAREDPPFGGPVSAIGAGLTAAQADTSDSTDIVLVLSADLPYVSGRELRELVHALEQDFSLDAVFGVDSSDRVQYLVGAWRRGALERGVATALRSSPPGDGRGPSLRRVLPDAVTTMHLAGIDDVDTPDELADARGASVRPTVARARFLLDRRVRPLPPRTVPPADSLGGTLAAPMIAAEPFPAFVTSAMDGYAVTGDGPWRLDDAVVVAGDTATVALAAGHAVRIATGAAVPVGASVLRDEFARTDTAGFLHRRDDAPVRDDARRIAEDWDVGTALASVGTTVSPAVLSAALSAGVAHVSVRPAPTVRLVLTGDEIGDDPHPVVGRIRDTIGPVMPIYLRWCGFSVTEVVHCEDTAAAFDDAVAGTGSPPPDVVVVIGATGGGAADRLSGALVRARGRRIVDGLACRPGGSASVSVLPDDRIVVGVPGNPYAAVSTVCLLGPALACALTGRPAPQPVTAELAADVTPATVTRVLPATYLGRGTWACQDSVRTAHLAALIGRDGLAVITPEWSPGDRVEIVSLPQR
ncbi:NTP transferase domain-containing protein [Rhodococcus sp. MEB064]|uniref:NTP transferase domain-containing protein n=1 Tax=Rhodococcus sp. MEB064 TaxID=1587522 RepID=UPI0005B6FBCF|nr:NTP transferase domain-containing protein [Rhodococcus sp. MEB064]KIQ19625.1 hypothetical protein RU01_04360 [Rhodococcus sp. MEB064]